jgi:hypothetical protein
MKVISFHAFVLFLATVAPAVGCMNTYQPRPVNRVAVQRSESVERQIFEDDVAEDWRDRAERLRLELERGGDFRVKNDLAVALAHTGGAARAVTLLEEIERKKPGLYMTAANLGTAYELAGDNVRALKWIRHGIERNANAHEGTEWLHVRILEAKLALAKDPKSLVEHTVLGFPINDLPEPVDIRGNRGEKLKSDKIEEALIYQLHERVQFVSRPDSVVGLLLFDLGRLITREPTGVGGAKDILLQAKSYLSGLDGMDTVYRAVAAFSLAAAEAQTREYTPSNRKTVIIAVCLWGLILVYASTRFLGRLTRRTPVASEL